MRACECIATLYPARQLTECRAKTRRMKREAPSDSAAPAQQKATLSEVITAFAAPLLALDANAAAEPDVLAQLMVLVDMCWNLPLLETSDPATHAKLKMGFDNVVKEMPKPVADQLQQLLVDRKGRFGSLAFLVHTRVERDAAGKARIVPEARKPRA